VVAPVFHKSSAHDLDSIHNVGSGPMSFHYLFHVPSFFPLSSVQSHDATQSQTQSELGSPPESPSLPETAGSTFSRLKPASDTVLVHTRSWLSITSDYFALNSSIHSAIARRNADSASRSACSCAAVLGARVRRTRPVPVDGGVEVATGA